MTLRGLVNFGLDCLSLPCLPVGIWDLVRLVFNLGEDDAIGGHNGRKSSLLRVCRLAYMLGQFEKRGVLKFGMPQLQQIQETFDPPRPFYTMLFMFLHWAWYHPSHSSHCTALQVHGSWQMQGNFEQLESLYEGPGFVSQSPACIKSIRQKYKQAWLLTLLFWRGNTTGIGMYLYIKDYVHIGFKAKISYEIP